MEILFMATLLVWTLIALITAMSFSRHLKQLKLLSDRKASDLVGGGELFAFRAPKN